MLARGAAAAVALVSPLQAQEQPPVPEPASSPAEGGVVIGYRLDRSERMTVPVSIDGRGPYSFLVDTGAQRTVIASELARDLRLDAGPQARVHSMSEVSDIATVLISALEVGGKKVRDIRAPALARRNLGAEGMLGVDSLRSQRVFFDFVRQQMTITPSRRREQAWPKDTIVVTGRSRFGHLVLIDASVDGQKVWVVIDTGSQVTVGNSALRRKLALKGRLGAMTPLELLSVTGGRIMTDATIVKLIKIGGMEVRGMPIAFADVHPFRQLKLNDRPAILLGMDVLSLFERVSVDFANRRVRLLAPENSSLRGEQRMARNQADRARTGG